MAEEYAIGAEPSGGMMIADFTVVATMVNGDHYQLAHSFVRADADASYEKAGRNVAESAPGDRTMFGNAVLLPPARLAAI